jgi:short-subunit dehydrogenase
MKSIKDKIVVATGASRGIGAAIARHMAKEGVRLVVCGRNKTALAEVKASLGLKQSDCAAVVADLSRAAGMKKIVSTAYKKFGKVDIFINNAGVGVRKDIVLTEEKEYDLIFDTNLKAIFFSFKELIPRMKKHGGGHIINISSMVGKQGTPGMAVYCASKGAVNLLSESVAGEVRNDNIKISVLAPGSTDTGFIFHLSDDLKPSPKNKRRMTADDVAEAAVHLAKQDENTWTSYSEMRPLIVKP